MTDSPVQESTSSPAALTPGLPAESRALPSEGGTRGYRHRLSAWLPVLFCVLVIATESTRYFGADHTSGPLRHFVEFFTGPFTDPQWGWLHHWIRKCGHFTGYGFLSIAWFRAFWMTLPSGASPYRRWFDAHLLAMVGTFVVASSDELHQLFLPNRSSSIVDVGIDCMGGLTMQIVLWAWMRRRIHA